MRNLVLALAVLGAVIPRGSEKVSPGQPMPELELRTVLGGDGRTKLSEFRGQPVLIAWYSTVFAGLEAARAAVKMEEELNGRAPGSRLAVFLMEIKNGDAAYLRALQMAELPEARCPLLRTLDLPVAYDDSLGPPPKLVLIGVDGTLLYAGTYQRAGAVEDLVQVELEKMEKGWGEDPVVREARALAFGQGKLGAARQRLEQAGLEGDERPRLKTELEQRFTALERSVAFHLGQGEPGRAAAAAEALTAAASGVPDWVARASAASATLATPESKREAELEQQLQALLKPTLTKKPKEGLDEKLRAFATGKAAGTKVGERATRLADAVARIAKGL